MAADYDPTRPVAAVRFGIQANPVTSVGGPRTSGVRERFLTLEELMRVWHGFGGADIAPTITAAILGIIAMGGIRVEEVAYARRDQLFERDGRTWISWPKTKNGRAQELPVTSPALEIFTWSQRMTGGSPYLFPSPGRDDAHITGNALPRAVRRWCEATEMEPWQPRDLRRTMKTHLNDRHPDLRAIGMGRQDGSISGEREPQRLVGAVQRVDARAGAAGSGRPPAPRLIRRRPCSGADALQLSAPGGSRDGSRSRP
ncbi:tyrosine-type recombinase/integrase [Acuticoccus kandeliae]|uniref:tyrosine-type recombinase/integrase n=1 Tax=Acuticoccus kandeliae TaxID=2073160 RepID=UPI003CCB913F